MATDWFVVVVGVGLVLIHVIDSSLGGWFAGLGISKNFIEYPLTAVVVGGLFQVFVQRDKGLPIKSSTFLKIGLVLMGVKVSMSTILGAGAGGLIQALIMVTSVFFFTWWLAGMVGLNDKVRAVMSAAVSICGVSAAIAAAGAVLADDNDIAFITALIIITALPMMLLMPWVAEMVGMSDYVAGAWFGGNIDTTAAVIGAGTIHGGAAQEIAAIVKMAQNVLIGVVAFLLALYFVMVVEKGEGERPSLGVIWQRFPKFVLGFLVLSALASFGVLDSGTITMAKGLSKWFFAAAFMLMGMEFSLKGLGDAGLKTIGVYLAATVFNTGLAYLVASVIFGGAL